MRSLCAISLVDKIYLVLPLFTARFISADSRQRTQVTGQFFEISFHYHELQAYAENILYNDVENSER